MPAKAEVKYGFWLGIGLLLAVGVLGVVQMLILRAVNRDG
jgi:hypothetical protein